jgi:hypothetical protein
LDEEEEEDEKGDVSCLKRRERREIIFFFMNIRGFENTTVLLNTLRNIVAFSMNGKIIEKLL